MAPKAPVIGAIFVKYQNLGMARPRDRRDWIASHEDLKLQIEAMEKKYDKQFRIVFEAITQLIEEDEKPKKKIGYIKEGQTKYGKRNRKN